MPSRFSTQVGVLALVTSVAWTAAAESASRADFRRPTDLPAPVDNPVTEACVELGRRLFFDPRLSGSDFISCASCHNPAFSWEDGMARATGHGMQKLGRSTPTVLNLAWAPALFWDGRAESLEAQALGPITAPGEMNLPIEELEIKLRGIREYGAYFEAAYPGKGIHGETIAKALACFERTLVSGTAPFDRWVSGDTTALSEAAQRGFEVFVGKGACASCHSGWRFTDDSFHDIGVKSPDRGRAEILPGIESLEHAFKTPTLRNVDRRAPYLHDGSLATLRAVIEFYDRGGDVSRPSLSDDIRPLGLSSRERADLESFLRSLTSEDRPVAIPAAPAR